MRSSRCSGVLGREMAMSDRWREETSSSLYWRIQGCHPLKYQLSVNSRHFIQMSMHVCKHRDYSYKCMNISMIIFKVNHLGSIDLAS